VKITDSEIKLNPLTFQMSQTRNGGSNNWEILSTLLTFTYLQRSVI